MSGKQDGASRRDFLKMAGATGPLAVAAVAVSGGTAQAAEPDLASNKMQDTLHTRAYLESAKF